MKNLKTCASLPRVPRFLETRPRLQWVYIEKNKVYIQHWIVLVHLPPERINVKSDADYQLFKIQLCPKIQYIAENTFSRILTKQTLSDC